ncbi:hypothetical protein C8R43DRAFT_1142888 [Mycena crocata]|nr:hypothetical protein C8R43DRAFT_1142888 [Mycena crocata]
MAKSDEPDKTMLSDPESDCEEPSSNSESDSESEDDGPPALMEFETHQAQLVTTATMISLIISSLQFLNAGTPKAGSSDWATGNVFTGFFAGMAYCVPDAAYRMWSAKTDLPGSRPTEDLHKGERHADIEFHFANNPEVPQFHQSAHTSYDISCTLPQFFGAGKTDGEAAERAWSALNDTRPAVCAPCKFTWIRGRAWCIPHDHRLEENLPCKYEGEFERPARARL